MYNNLLKRILFPSLSIYFFPHFFPSPKSKFRRIMGKNGNFFYFENRKFVSLSFHILFSPIFPHPQIQISVCLEQKWGWTPPHSWECVISVVGDCSKMLTMNTADVPDAYHRISVNNNVNILINSYV